MGAEGIGLKHSSSTSNLKKGQPPPFSSSSPSPSPPALTRPVPLPQPPDPNPPPRPPPLPPQPAKPNRPITTHTSLNSLSHLRIRQRSGSGPPPPLRSLPPAKPVSPPPRPLCAAKRPSSSRPHSPVHTHFQSCPERQCRGQGRFRGPERVGVGFFHIAWGSILLRISNNWDWFINLSAADYPLVNQDDLLHILSYLPKDLTFVNHTSYIGYRESRRLKSIIVDPGIFLLEEDETFYVTQKRNLPNAYRLFTGSPSAISSRKFIEFCILGTDNLPRTLLLYLTNMPSALSVYFPSILCNPQQFKRTAINHGLHYTSFDAKQEARPLNASNYDDMIQSGAALATPFVPDDPVLDHIDREVLGRGPGEPVAGV